MKNTDLCRKTILDLIPYVPGKPIEEVKRELGIDDIIKLASNENPLGPSPKALAAMKDALDNIALYPEGSCHDLRNELAKFLGVGTDNLIFGCGSSKLVFEFTHCGIKLSLTLSYGSRNPVKFSYLIETRASYTK